MHRPSRRAALGRIAAMLLAGLLCAWVGGEARGAGFAGEMDLVLRDALLGTDADPKTASNLVLHLETDGSEWAKVWGKGFTISEHPGVVESGEVSDEAVRLRVRMLILGDFWTKGEWAAVYDLTFERKADGRLEGRFEGTYDGVAVSGEASGVIPPPRRVREDIAPPAFDEHPRVLFRKSDLPRLKEKLRTPFGRAYLEKAEEAGDLISLGMLYQLTGETAWADKARAAIEAEYMNKGDGKVPVYGFGSGGFGHDIFRVAVTYDLSGEAWPEAFNRWLLPQLEAFTERQQHVLMTSHANYHPCSNYYGPGRGVPGVVAMILWGDPGSAPKEPHDPIERAWPVRPTVETAPEGMTVEPFEVGRLPKQWIWTGLLPYECSRDVLSKLGGYAKARPEAGTMAEYTVKSGSWFKMAALQFKAMPAAMATGTGIDVGKASETGEASVSVYFTYVRVDEEQALRPGPMPEGVRLWISTIEIEDTQFYRLYPGVHPVTLEVRIEKTEGAVSPVLVEIDPNAEGGLQALYRVRRALWQRDHAHWEATGMDPTRPLWLHRGWFQNWQHYRWGIGDGGFMAETGGYAQISSWYPSVYGSMYPNFFGREVSPYPDVDHIMPRQITQSTFPPPDPSAKKTGGKAQAMRVNSTLTLRPQWLACHFPIIPPEYQPSALWVWNYLMGVEGEDTVPGVLGSGRTHVWGLGGLTLAQTFLHYPLDMEPVHPSQGMPLDWRADTFGLHVFRSGYGTGEEFVAQTFGKSSNIKGWNHPNAGQFQIWGLGHPWTWTDASPGSIRATCSVVLLPEDELNNGGFGQLVHRAAGPDGSGTVTFDMGDVYAKRSRGLFDGMLIRDPSARVESGVTGLRAFGFDYSGASGAPALVAIVDQIDGGGKRLWTWQKPEGAKATVENGSFTFAYPDATMRATFVAPRNPPVVYADDAMKEGGGAKHGFWGTLHRIKAEGDGSFFVVVTFQRGKAPPVTVEGEGLDAVITVGKQTVRFDGTKVIFGS